MLTESRLIEGKILSRLTFLLKFVCKATRSGFELRKIASQSTEKMNERVRRETMHENFLIVLDIAKEKQ